MILVVLLTNVLYKHLDLVPHFHPLDYLLFVSP
jgi:hypothetical protein